MILLSWKAARVNAKLSQDDVASKLGVTRTTVSNWETGERVPTLKRAKALSALYGVPLDMINTDA